jgi:hypothetical protein
MPQKETMTMKPGRYNAKITAHELGESSNGNPQMAVEFEITDGPEAGQKITWWGHFTAAAAPYTKEKMQTCAPSWDGRDIDTFAPEGNSVSINVKEETYNGEAKLKVAFIDPIGGGGLAAAKKLEPAKAAQVKRGINALLAGRPAPARAATAAVAKPATQRVPPKPAPVDDFGAEPAGDDEIPF